MCVLPLFFYNVLHYVCATFDYECAALGLHVRGWFG
jgi:hypothetical protein